MKCAELGCKNLSNTYGHCWDCNDRLILKDQERIGKTNTKMSKEEKFQRIYDKHNLACSKWDDKPIVKLTLPTDSAERKEIPLFRGVLMYFSAALAGVAKISKQGNDKHNPGQDLYHARNKSTDHGDCILRHLMDVTDLLVAKERGTEVSNQQILDEVSQMAWRALAMSQELHEKIGNAPLAPGAKE